MGWLNQQASEASLVAQMVNNPPAMQETWVRSLGWEDPWRRERRKGNTPVFWPGEFHRLYSPQGHKESDTTERLSLHYVRPSIRSKTKWHSPYSAINYLLHGETWHRPSEYITNNMSQYHYNYYPLHNNNKDVYWALKILRHASKCF